MAQQIAASIFDINLRVRKAALVVLVILAATLMIVPAAEAQTLTILHNFTAGSDGAKPQSGVILDQVGNIYGTTTGAGLQGGCGPHDCGNVFKLSRRGSGWVLNSLYNFQGGTDGAQPFSNVLVAPDGTLYGNTFFGGIPGCGFGGGCGTVFRLRPSPNVCRSSLCPWTETVLYRFDDGDGGRHPSSAPVLDAAGNVYGVNLNGGAGNPYGCVGFDGGCGVLYQLTNTNGVWIENVLYSFTGGQDGGTPYGNLVLEASSNIYGTALLSGSEGYGLVFQAAPSGSGWSERGIYYLQVGSQGGSPDGVIADSAGNLYGAAEGQGPNGGGTLYELTPANGGWNFFLLYAITGPCCNPEGPGMLVMDRNGNLYGATLAEGSHGWGSVFKLTPSSGGWTYTDLHDFTGGADGGWPNTPVAVDSSGKIYGTTQIGGADGYGVVFETTP